jgi:hypothetical protein
MDGFKIMDTVHTDHVDLYEEEQTLSDRSKVHNVVVRTIRNGRVRFCMTDESASVRFASDLAKLLDEYGDKMVAVEIDPETV